MTVSGGRLAPPSRWVFGSGDEEPVPVPVPVTSGCPGLGTRLLTSDLLPSQKGDFSVSSNQFLTDLLNTL